MECKVVETIYGFKNINPFYGDILNSKYELLVISTHANPEMGMDGILVNALKKRFDVDIQSGCKQIVEGKGFSASNPLVDLDVLGFSDLMHLFHFYKGARKSKELTHNGENGILDQITFEHFMEEKRIATLFNFVTYPHKDNK